MAKRGRRPVFGPGNAKGIAAWKKNTKKAAKAAVKKALTTPLKVHNPGCPFPLEMKTKIRYAQTYSQATVAGVGSLQYLYGPSAAQNAINSLQSLACPFLSEVFALYNRYRVDAVKFTAHLHQSSGNPSNVVIGFVNGTPPAYLGSITYIDLPYTKFTNVVAYQPTKLSGSVKLHKLAGVSEAEYMMADRFQSLHTTQPAELMNLIIATDNQYNSGQTVYLLLRVELTVTFMDPIELAT